MGISHDPCARCGRLPADSDEHATWEAVVTNGRVVLICPGCVTHAERRAIDEDWLAAEEEVARGGSVSREDWA
jgi:hypothetical protein